MKRLISILFMAVLLFTMTACGNSGNSGNAANSENNGQTDVTEPVTVEAGTEAIPEEAGKAIVVYFSGSGNTKRVAEFAADELGADLFELVPVTPYSEEDLNWRNWESRVCREHEDMSLRDIELVSTEVPDWDQYDVVLFGYPIWWREAAWPVNNFIKNNDFTGKTVVPFCTSTSSGMGDSGILLSEMTGTGNWQAGNRFSEQPEEASVREWVRSMNLE